MTEIVLRHKYNEHFNIVYDLNAVEKISHGKYKDFYDKSDIDGNGVKPNDSVIIITFDDGSQASFGSDYEITFEK